jgi:hypothetical protein
MLTSNGGSGSTSITDGLDNGTVTSNELGSSKERKRNGRSREEHPEPAGGLLIELVSE